MIKILSMSQRLFGKSLHIAYDTFTATCSEFILEHLDLNINATRIGKVHTKMGRNETGGGLAREYFGQLTTGLVDRLYETYRLDFELFDYNIEPYRSYAKPGGGAGEDRRPDDRANQGRREH